MKKTEHNSKTETLLREKGLKVTQTRIAILSLFSEKCHPLRAEDIFKKLSPDVDLVTVYRTLASFEEKGIVRKVDLHKDAVYFELDGDHHHHHIVCENCGKIEKFEMCLPEILVKKAASQSAGFSRINGHSLEFFGICKTCVKA